MKLWLSIVDDERGSIHRAKSLEIGDIFSGKTAEEINEIVDSLSHWVADRVKAKPWSPS